MKQRIDAVRVGSSHNTERLAELKANRERLQEMLASGWQVKEVKVKRPRIKKEPKPRKLVIAISGWESLGTITVSFEDYERDYKSCCRIVTKFF